MQNWTRREVRQWVLDELCDFYREAPQGYIQWSQDDVDASNDTMPPIKMVISEVRQLAAEGIAKIISEPAECIQCGLTANGFNHCT